VVNSLEEIQYYKGLYKVKVTTQSEGYWIVEAQEDFEDYQDDKRVVVKKGERKIVQPSEVHKKKVLSPPIPEHVYERNLEKKVRQMVEDYEAENKHTIDS
jgi:hypothetical protein